MTQYEAYNEAFWIAVVTAAPVIALTGAVQITDVQKLFDKVTDLTDQERTYFSEWRYTTLPILFSSTNVLAQTISIYSALISIAHHSNFETFNKAILQTITGMLTILLVTFLNVSGRNALNKAKRAKAKKK